MWRKVSNLSLDQKLTLSISIIAVIAAIWSAVIADRANEQANAANQTAAEANQIAVDANDLVAKSLTQSLPAIEISNWDQALHDLHQNHNPCIDRSSNTTWNKDRLVYFDISNYGGRALALLDVSSLERINTGVENLLVEVTFTFFQSLEDFDQWVQERGFDPMELSFREHAKVSTPLNIGPGETYRIVLKEHTTMKVDSSLGPRELLTAVRGYDWIAHPTFMFARDITVQQEIQLWSPYIGTRIEISEVPAFESCHN